ncbi:hypothetical protein WMY93_034100, partial [Mugilogobius chulae]
GPEFLSCDPVFRGECLGKAQLVFAEELASFGTFPNGIPYATKGEKYDDSSVRSIFSLWSETVCDIYTLLQ